MTRKQGAFQALLLLLLTAVPSVGMYMLVAYAAQA